MKTSSRLRNGMGTALLILAALIFLPPLVVDKLDAWHEAPSLLAENSRLIEQCGLGVRVDLSRWFYTYRFSGSNAYAKFRATAISSVCNKSLIVELKKQGNVWQLVEWKDY
ncbi:hypothetical protein [Aquabacterium sp. CECT 9606]|uniref:hypothetical protein n=1 Tax=Aquabacterium sp. CECT 9606 TaxID=2845822 RepID=UPI001E405B54|nr:hypothetical protein [Aquabacterium sp. CECT 9606]